MFSKDLEFTIGQCYKQARESRHEFMTVEHLLLALLDNSSAMTVLRACGGEPKKLGEELRTLKLYAGIMLERFRDRVTLDWQTDQALLDTAVPALLLQPLLENVFKHGVEPTVEHVRIMVSVRREAGSVEIVIANSGFLLASEQRDGVGLRNCRERLSIIYGNTASLLVHNEGDGVAARVLIPLPATIQ